VSSIRRSRSRNKTSDYASVLAALEDMWSHRAEQAAPVDGEPVVSLAAYRVDRRAAAGHKAAARTSAKAG
jgi:hypothetical protein